MCGIVGIRRFDGSPANLSTIQAMTAQLLHRGPDSEGHWSHGSVAFGHTRLSIIDISGSSQPMSTYDDQVTICFNGEILNYKELRSKSPYQFRTSGDTETILARYLDIGISMLDELRGQFAMAIFDKRDDSLYLARDRMGILPLYYAFDGHQVSFASEIKAVLTALEHQPSVDLSSLDAYLAHRSVPAPATLFTGIRKLEPGMWAKIDADGSVTERRWWKLEPREIVGSLTPSAAVDLLGEQLTSAVDECLVADVPVGAYLSGGVDSSLICALAAQQSDRTLQTFSAGFDDPRVDELSYAAQVSKHLGTDHHPIVLHSQDLQDLWHRLTWHRDAPISEPADLAVFRLAELARRHVKVVLSGEGSDELFGGYPKYRYANLADRFGIVPQAVRGPLLEFTERHLPQRLAKLRIAIRATAATSEERSRSWFSPFTQNERARLLGGGVPPSRPPISAGRNAIERLMLTDCGPWLADNLLERGDRMSMAASLELRPPFLDERLIETALSIPNSIRVHGGVTKWAVKEVARRHLPSAIVDRRKVGFRVPLDSWFRQGLRDMSSDLLLGRNSFVGEIMDRRSIIALIDDHQKQRSDEEIRIWTLLSLEVWHQRFFKNVEG